MAEAKDAVFSRLDLSTSIDLSGDPEDNFMRPFSGTGYGYFDKKVCFEDGVPDAAIQRVGHIDGWYMDFSQAEASVYDLLDEDADTEPFVCLYKSDGSFDPIVVDLLSVDPYGISPNYLLVFHVLYIEPEFRGHNFAGSFFNETIKALRGDADVIALDVSPLQISGWGKKEEYDLDKFGGWGESESIKKLSHHYSKFGFKAVPDSTVMIAFRDWF
mgnify:CR=1 FL=1